MRIITSFGFRRLPFRDVLDRFKGETQRRVKNRALFGDCSKLVEVSHHFSDTHIFCETVHLCGGKPAFHSECVSGLAQTGREERKQSRKVCRCDEALCNPAALLVSLQRAKGTSVGKKLFGYFSTSDQSILRSVTQNRLRIYISLNFMQRNSGTELSS